MPVMDGLELAKNLEEANIKMIILTGYGEFEYAQKAIEYRVSEFMLKPVGADELVRVVLKLKDEILHEKKKAETRSSYEKLIKENIPVIQERLLYQLLNGLYTGNEKDKFLRRMDMLNIDLSGPSLQVFIIAIDDYFHLVGNQSIEHRRRIFDSIIEISERSIYTYTKGYIYHGEIGMFVALVNKGQRFFDIMALSKKIQLLISRKLNLPVSIGIGNEVKDISHIHQSYSEALNAVRNRVYLGKNSIIQIDDVLKESACTSATYINSFSEEENELLIHMKLINYKKVDNLIKSLFNRLIDEKADFNCIKNISLYLIIAAIKGIKELGICVEDRLDTNFDPFLEIEEYETVELIREWMQGIFRKLLLVIENEKNEKYKYIVKCAMDYMVQHYDEPLSLTSVAQEVHVTPNYLSKVFREETGKNFIEWLNKYRIEKAKKCLLNIGMKTYEVAKMVGFNNYKHFSYNFKKYTGVSPLEFRERK
jgi:two-component system response regulator YesN